MKKFLKFIGIISGIFLLIIIAGTIVYEVTTTPEEKVLHEQQRMEEKKQEEIEKQAREAELVEQRALEEEAKAKEEEEKREQERIDLAFICSQAQIEKMLISPSSAKFPTMRSGGRVNTIDNGIYGVESYVDAQNTFGVMLRKNYLCKISGVDVDNYTCLLNECKFVE